MSKFEDIYFNGEWWDFNYVPVCCGFTENRKINSKDISWFKNDSIYPYYRILVNPFHQRDTWRRDMARRDVLVFSDSGGLQDLRHGTRINHIDVFKWQERNADVGFSFDIIPFDIEKQRYFTGDKFDDCARQSKEKAHDCFKIKSREDFKFYGIIQGDDIASFERWYDILKDDRFDGYCVKAVGNDPVYVAITSLFVMKRLKKPVHFLGIGNISKSIVCAYLSKYYDYPISYDSSSYDVGTQYRNYEVLPNWGFRIMKDYDNHVFPVCCCPACNEWLPISDKMIKSNDYRLGGLLSLHNMYRNVSLSHIIRTLLHDREQLDGFLKTIYGKSVCDKIKRALDILDFADKHGVESAIKTYEPLFKTLSRSEEAKTRNLFGEYDV